MATLAELLNDKTKSDDIKITVEGAETTLGEIRKGVLMQSDYTRKTTSHAEERRAFQQMQQQFQQDKDQWEIARADAEAKLADFARQIVQGNPRATVDDVTEAINSDPVARRLVGELSEVRNQLANLEKKDAEKSEYLRKLELSRFEDQHRTVLAELRKKDPDLDEEALIRHAQTRYIPRLDVAYRDLKFEESIEAARKEGEKAGMEKGMTRMKKELSQPVLPTRRVVAAAPEAPKSWNEAVDVALGDPYIMNAWQGLDPQ